MGYEQFDSSQPTMPGSWPRKCSRVSLDAEVSLRRPGKSTYRVRVYDASPHGCKIEFVERPMPADRAWIKFDGLEPLESLVCWVKGFAAGVQFEKPIHPAVFERLMASLKHI
jgi:hypothetical protein